MTLTAYIRDADLVIRILRQAARNYIDHPSMETRAELERAHDMFPHIARGKASEVYRERDITTGCQLPAKG